MVLKVEVALKQPDHLRELSKALLRLKYGDLLIAPALPYGL